MSFAALVIEDDPVGRRAITGILKGRLDFKTVSEAENGLDGLRVLKKQKFNLVLVDWVMPVMNGYNFVRTVRMNPVFFDIPIVMVTSKRAQKDIVDAIKVGVTDYLTKPFDDNALVDKVLLALQFEKASRKESEYLQKAAHHRQEKIYGEALRYYSLAAEIVPGRAETKMKIAEVISLMKPDQDDIAVNSLVESMFPA